MRWEFDDALVAHDVHSPGRQLGPEHDDRSRPDGPPVDAHVRRPGHLHVPVHAPRGHDAARSRSRTRRPARQRARVLQDRRLPPRLDPAGHRGDPAARHGQRLHRRPRPRTPPRSPTRTSRSTTSSSSSRRPATSSTPTSRPRSSATSRAAAATPASTPRPTPSTRGPGTASWSAATSAATRPERPPPTVDIEDGDEPSTTGLPASWTAHGRVVQLPGHHRPGGERQRRRSRTTARAPPRPRARDGRRGDLRRAGRQHGRRRPPGRVVLRVRRRPLLVHGDGPHAGLVRRANFRSHLLGGLRTAAGVDGRLRRAAREPPPTAADFEKVTLDDDTKAPMEIAVADGRPRRSTSSSASGHRRPAIQASAEPWGDRTRVPTVAGTIPVDNVARERPDRHPLAPDFDTSPATSTWPTPRSPDRLDGKDNRVSRFTITRQPARPGSSRSIYEWTAPAPGVLPHRRLAGLRPRRQPLHLHGRQHEPVRPRLQPDRRARRPRSSGTPSARRPTRTTQRQDPAHRPARRRRRRAGRRDDATRSRPATCSAAGTAQTLPEIFAMGFRNPFRITSTRRPAGC